ncbi:MAG: hypothetical protein U5L72_19615 [Bacteroidales bacterium]|nr:hypothetical protein [Bacteroidales bacterium]
MTFGNKACEFGYRDSLFKRELKNRAVICSVVFRLSRTPHLRLDYGGIRQRIADREITDPTYGYCRDCCRDQKRQAALIMRFWVMQGGFFKNPLLSELRN